MRILVGVPRRATGAAFAALLLGWGSVACGSGTAAEGSPKVTPAAAVAKAAKKAEASMKAEPLVMSMKMTSFDSQRGGRPLEIRFVDRAMYVRGSTLRPEKLKGKSWFSAAPAVWGSGAVDNRSYGVLPGQLQANPIAQSRLLTASKDLRTLGTETVAGVTTTHYAGTVHSRALIRESLDQFMQLEISEPNTTTRSPAPAHST